jgi:hypothetical protein
VPVAVGRTSVNLYTIIDPGMHVEERTHAFQINKTALASTPVDLRVQLEALGQQLNLATTVDGVRDDWLMIRPVTRHVTASEPHDIADARSRTPPK